MSSTADYKLAGGKEEHDGYSSSLRAFCYWRRRPWTIATFASLFQFIHIGFLYNFGLFIGELQHDFNSSATLTGWVASISYCFFMFGTVLTTWTLRRLSCRKVAIIGVMLGSLSLLVTSFSPTIECVIVFYGVFFGMSSNISMIVSNEVVVPLFQDKRRASAMVLVAIGGTIGTFSMSNLIEYSLQQFGWRLTFRIFSAILFVVEMVCCSFFSGPTADVSSQHCAGDVTGEESKSYPSGRLICLPETWLLSLATVTFYLAAVFQFVYMASFLESIGLSDQKSATGITLLAIGDSLSKILMFFVVPRVSFPLIYCLPVSLLVMSILSLVLTWTNNIFVIFAVTLGYGFPRGMFIGLQIITGLEMFGASRSKTSANIIMVSSGVGNLAGPLIYGFLYDLIGSYFPALYLCAALYLVSSVTILMTPLWQKYFAPERYMVDYKPSEDSIPEVNQNHPTESMTQMISVV